MPGTPATHPSAEDLQSFGLGKLNDAAAEVILRHLENCPDCHKQVAALSGDSFLDKLRAARGRSSTPTPARSLSGVARILQPTREPRNPPPMVEGLPPELVNSTQYEVMRELGRGGMGVVYLAKNGPKSGQDYVESTRAGPSRRCGRSWSRSRRKSCIMRSTSSSSWRRWRCPASCSPRFWSGSAGCVWRKRRVY